MKPFYLLALLLLLVLLATGLAYARAQAGPAIFDDEYVFDDPVRSPHEFGWAELKASVTETKAEPKRWLTSLTFALNFRYFHAGTISFHLVNLLMHYLAVIACFGFVREILRLAGREPDQAARVAFLAAAFFALNPIQTQAVSYIWQRATVLAAGIALTSLWFFVAGLRCGRYKIVIAILLVPFAVLAKQNAIMVVPAMVGIALLFRAPKTPAGVTMLLVGGTGALVLTYYAAAAFWWGGESAVDVLSRGYEGREFTTGERLLTQPRVVLHLLSLILVPLPGRLNLDHDVAVSTDLFMPWTTFPAHLALLLAVLISLVVASRRPLVTLGVLWYMVMLVPESTVFPLELMFEHRAYLPSVGVFLLLALAVDAMFRRRRPVAVALTIVALLALATMTWSRNEVWTSRVLMWEDVTAKSPNKARGHFNLGMALRDRCRDGSRAALLEARKSFARALELEGRDDYARALIQIGVYADLPPDEYLEMLLVDIERLRLAGQSARAESILRRLCRAKPADPQLRYELARVLASSGGIPEAFDALEKALDLGFDDREKLGWDPALSSLRPKRRFHALMEKLE